jgi:hypothetical protein
VALSGEFFLQNFHEGGSPVKQVVTITSRVPLIVFLHFSRLRPFRLMKLGNNSEEQISRCWVGVLEWKFITGSATTIRV